MIDLLNSDARRIPLADQSVQCIITSPPYWGLRDYGTATWQGGDPGCDHKERNARNDGNRNGIDGFAGSMNLNGHADMGAKQYRDTCSKCGAIRIDAQIGLERVPDCLGWVTGRPCGECYVCHIVAVMRECWRVLRPDGVCWLNLGDSYASSGIKENHNGTGSSTLNCLKPGYIPPYHRQDVGAKNKVAIPAGLKPKDLCMIPARIALALQAAGWYLRSEIVWNKSNPMPESVTDRPTKAHEMIYLLTKEPRYYYDAIAIAEETTDEEYRTVGKIRPTQDNRPGFEIRGGLHNQNGGRATRNRRSVWTVATQPYSGAHYAVFPIALIEPMILAGTSARGACPTCGKAWTRVVDRNRLTRPELPQDDPRYRPHTYSGAYENINGKGDAGYTEVSTLGWRPACACYDVPLLPDEPDDTSNGDVAAYQAERARVLDLYNTLPVVPCIVLDPFAGSGTVGKVAVKHVRRFVGCELNREYIDLAFERTSKVQTVMQL